MPLEIAAASFAGQRLVSLLSKLMPTQTAPSDTAATASTSTTTAATDTPPDNCLSGSTQPSLSGDILTTLLQLQADSSDSSTTPSTAASTTPATTATATSDPLQTLFNAMDSDGDGSVSQSEMESYIQNAGGTAAQGDALYNALNTNGSSTGISESQLASAAQQAGPAGHHHHHHHHGGGAGGGSDPVDALMSLLGGGPTGSVTQDQFSSFVTSNGGTASDAASDFTALDADQSGTLTASDLQTDIKNAQTPQNTGPLLVSMLDAFAKAGARTGATPSSTAASTTSITA